MKSVRISSILPPYKIPAKLKAGDQKTYVKIDGLLYFGLTHTKNPQDKQLTKLEEALNTFYKTNIRRKKILLVEGSVPPYTVPKTGVPKYGENAFLLHWAKKNNVTIKSIEPASKLLLKAALSKHSKKQTILWIFLNLLANGNDCEQALKIALSSIRLKRGELIDFRKYLINQFAKLQDDKISFYDAASPYLKKYPTNKIAATVNSTKDLHMAMSIMKFVQKGYAVFGVAHVSHVYAQFGFFQK